MLINFVVTISISQLTNKLFSLEKFKKYDCLGHECLGITEEERIDNGDEKQSKQVIELESRRSFMKLSPMKEIKTSRGSSLLSKSTDEISDFKDSIVCETNI